MLLMPQVTVLRILQDRRARKGRARGVLRLQIDSGTGPLLTQKISTCVPHYESRESGLSALLNRVGWREVQNETNFVIPRYAPLNGLEHSENITPSLERACRSIPAWSAGS